MIRQQTKSKIKTQKSSNFHYNCQPKKIISQKSVIPKLHEHEDNVQPIKKNTKQYQLQTQFNQYINKKQEQDKQNNPETSKQSFLQCARQMLKIKPNIYISSYSRFYTQPDFKLEVNNNQYQYIMSEKRKPKIIGDKNKFNMLNGTTTYKISYQQTAKRNWQSLNKLPIENEPYKTRQFRHHYGKQQQKRVQSKQFNQYYANTKNQYETQYRKNYDKPKQRLLYSLDAKKQTEATLMNKKLIKAQMS